MIFLIITIYTPQSKRAPFTVYTNWMCLHALILSHQPSHNCLQRLFCYTYSFTIIPKHSFFRLSNWICVYTTFSKAGNAHQHFFKIIKTYLLQTYLLIKCYEQIQLTRLKERRLPTLRSTNVKAAVQFLKVIPSF